ncbi:unnamed protein product [Rotaria sordida]|uniref:Uncharacterized protein n=1 Tax=Rotaria sordida TaxID=392033 RepID=A0A813P2X6_9BILA|nr:unnamed protein product [Rotaria sordida]CAF0785265.1 unnamed protein product [Rotaria sordida]CAF0922111.1 unnamed protein product [Rotaria sordida]CAF3659179.1 unnamed protein product [Rotaria sordida]CAF3666278.1 unnamed protein product [Rotaria sordida]
MSTSEEAKGPAKSSIIDYVENFIDKRNNELRATTVNESDVPLAHGIDRDSIVFKTDADGFQRKNVDKDPSELTDVDADDFNLDSDPIIETREADEQVYKQQVYLRQYQPPTPDPIDIQIQEIIVKPKIQRPPIHVYVGPTQDRDAQRTPSPILIKSAPPQLPPSSGEPIVYNKYVPLDYKPPRQQIIIHRYPEMPPKPRPIVVEQWLPNKPAPKRVTYRHVNRDELLQSEARQQHNRFIEYTKPHTTVELEIVRLPIIKLKPEEYHGQSNELARVDNIRSLANDPNILQWRI